MLFNVLNGNPSFASNALKSGDREATKRQTPEEHQELLDITKDEEYPKLIALKNTPAYFAFEQYLNEKAKLREAEDPHYWDDEKPRRPINQSSSWVGNIQYNPDTNLLTIALGNKGASKTVYSTPDKTSDLINAPSIGSKINHELFGR